jgi:hypothetical protein
MLMVASFAGIVPGAPPGGQVGPRLDPKDYAFLEAVRDNKDPPEGDLKALEEAVELVLDSEP